MHEWKQTSVFIGVHRWLRIPPRLLTSSFPPRTLNFLSESLQSHQLLNALGGRELEILTNQGAIHIFLVSFNDWVLPARISHYPRISIPIVGYMYRPPFTSNP